MKELSEEKIIECFEIDDPLKAANAVSKAKRVFVNDWFGSTLTSRLDVKSNGAIIIVTQRLHADDQLIL